MVVPSPAAPPLRYGSAFLGSESRIAVPARDYYSPAPVSLADLILSLLLLLINKILLLLLGTLFLWAGDLRIENRSTWAVEEGSMGMWAAICRLGLSGFNLAWAQPADAGHGFCSFPIKKKCTSLNFQSGTSNLIV
jgi:hypothetical protein